MSKRKKDHRDEENDEFRWETDFFDDTFEREFERMREILERFFERADKISPAGFPERPIIYGFSLRVGPDGKPVFQKFGNLPDRIEGGEFKALESAPREPLTDIVDAKDSFSVTLEVPGVEKDDIDLTVSGGVLCVKVDAPNRKYLKEIELPNDVDEKSAKASFKNGVLDITFAKKKGEIEGFKIKVQ
ncbi:MAG: Hsp20 family protein [Thermoplasmata archaeon]|nr:Hsp20 family protein [Thermoplasmata archaeon]